MINESLGQEWGDAVLRSVAQGLNNTVRGGYTLARIEGDQFAVLCGNAEQDVVEDRLKDRIEGVMSEVNKELSLDGCTPHRQRGRVLERRVRHHGRGHAHPRPRLLPRRAKAPQLVPPAPLARPWRSADPAQRRPVPLGVVTMLQSRNADHRHVRAALQDLGRDAQGERALGDHHPVGTTASAPTVAPA